MIGIFAVMEKHDTRPQQVCPCRARKGQRGLQAGLTRVRVLQSPLEFVLKHACLGQPQPPQQLIARAEAMIDRSPRCAD
jgi:hypothetical protein